VLPALSGKTFTIDGTDITIDAGAESGIFYVNSDATATISYFTLTNAAVDPAVVNDGTLNLNGGTLRQAQAAGIVNRGNLPIDDEYIAENYGGAIINLAGGTMTINDSTL